MRTSPLPEFQSEASLPNLPFAPLDGAVRALATAQSLSLHEGHGRSVWCAVAQGEFGAKQRGQGSLLFAHAHHPGDLPALQQQIAALAGVVPAWSSGADAGKFPPNFSLAHVESTVRISDNFMRLRLRTDNLERFSH